MAKVVPRGVTHLDMVPYDPAGPLVVAAGDKAGGLLRTSTQPTSYLPPTLPGVIVSSTRLASNLLLLLRKHHRE